jgi:DNA-binding transcriptional MerR regulator
MEGPDQHLTIDELARRAGIATSTVRMYQTKGVLPPPRREGRVGYYGAGHLARLRLIGQLQEEGYSLTSIGRLVDAWESGRSLDDVLGLEMQIADVWGVEEPVRMRPEELASHFPDGALTPDFAQGAIAMGLVGVDGDDLVVHSPRLLEIGSELAQLGLSGDEVLDELRTLHEATKRIAERFTSLFERHLWRPFVERGLPGDEIRNLTDVLQRLSSLAEGVVNISLRESLRRAAGSFLAQQAEELERAGVLADLKPLAAAVGLDLSDDN